MALSVHGCGARGALDGADPGPSESLAPRLGGLSAPLDGAALPALAAWAGFSTRLALERYLPWHCPVLDHRPASLDVDGDSLAGQYRDRPLCLELYHPIGSGHLWAVGRGHCLYRPALVGSRHGFVGHRPLVWLRNPTELGAAVLAVVVLYPEPWQSVDFAFGPTVGTDGDHGGDRGGQWLLGGGLAGMAATAALSAG
jgi:hypothetical protein